MGVRVQVPVSLVPDLVIHPQQQDGEEVQEVTHQLHRVRHGQSREESVGGRPHVPPGEDEDGQDVADQARHAHTGVEDEARDELSHRVELPELLVTRERRLVHAPMHGVGSHRGRAPLHGEIVHRGGGGGGERVRPSELRGETEGRVSG